MSEFLCGQCGRRICVHFGLEEAVYIDSVASQHLIENGGP